MNTKYGFDFGALRVERVVEHKGYVVVRICNRISGKYVDVSTTPKGKKQYVSVGTLNKDTLKSWLEK